MAASKKKIAKRKLIKKLGKTRPAPAKPEQPSLPKNALEKTLRAAKAMRGPKNSPLMREVRTSYRSRMQKPK